MYKYQPFQTYVFVFARINYRLLPHLQYHLPGYLPAVFIEHPQQIQKLIASDLLLEVTATIEVFQLRKDLDCYLHNEYSNFYHIFKRVNLISPHQITYKYKHLSTLNPLSLNYLI